MGLTLYGPCSEYPIKIPIGIIGDSKTVDQVRKVLDYCSSYVEGPNDYPLWTQDFPGSRKALRCDFLVKDKWCEIIIDKEIQELEKIYHYKERIGFSVRIFCDRITKIKAREESPQIFICAPSIRMMDLCIPPAGERGTGRRGRQSKFEKSRKYITVDGYHPLQSSLFDFDKQLRQSYIELLQKEVGDNFHHFLKAHAMKLKTPTQFIRPYTLEKIFDETSGKIQDMATICWNLSVALYYKAGGRPWRLSDIQSGTCFAGITFYREKRVFGGQIGTSLAQVFTPEGEGLVIRGERVEWKSRKEPHLSKDAAKRIMTRIIEAYKHQTNNKPTRIVIHKSSTFNDDEKSGFQEALNDIPRHDFVTIPDKGRMIKFYRAGYHPIIRGTIITLSDNSRFLYTKGYVPFMKVYPGPRVPRPLEIIFSETDSSHDQLCHEIIGLSRLNWNSADFSCLYPITMHFSNRVGQILKELPPGTTPESKFLYYI